MKKVLAIFLSVALFVCAYSFSVYSATLYDVYKEIKFTNNLGWDNVYVYVWDDGWIYPGFTEWPGDRSYDKTTNQNNEEVYSFFVPYDADGIIFNNGEGDQTEDITDYLEYDGFLTDGTKDDENHYKVAGYADEHKDDTTHADFTDIPHDFDPGVSITDTLNWGKMYLYSWDKNGNPLTGEVPGKELTEKWQDGLGHDVFDFTVSRETEGFCVYNSSGERSGDITDFWVCGNYWLENIKDDNGYYIAKRLYVGDPDPKETVEPAENTLGDVNGDGLISVTDATLVQQQAAELITLEDSALAAADTNRDGIVTVADATLIQQYAAEMIDEF